MTITGNEPAKPTIASKNHDGVVEIFTYNDGLTIRQEFARTAMQAMIPLYWSDQGSWTMESVAEGAVEMADALIAELNKPKP